MGAGLGLPGRGDWVVVLPTQKLLQTNLAMEGRTDTQTPYKTNHPSTLYGCRRNFFLPLTRSRRFVRIKSLAILKGLIKSWSKFKAYHG